jgi:hypothetical protein
MFVLLLCPPRCLARLARIEKEAGIQPAAKPAAAAASKGAKGDGSGNGKGGAKFAGLLDELLEGDFDPEEYDRRMAEAFDDEYYEVRGWSAALVSGVACWVGAARTSG